MKNEKGITLVALVITIIVLVIIIGISLGNLGADKGNINTAKNVTKKYDLTQVQQLILEEYKKYKLIGNTAYLHGTQITWSEANTELQSIATKAEKTLELKESNYDEIDNLTPEKYYYKLEPGILEKIGFKNSEDTYIVNYETGEVFNITSKVTKDKEALYLDI